jgi:hypothetical protein
MLFLTAPGLIVPDGLSADGIYYGAKSVFKKRTETWLHKKPHYAPAKNVESAAFMVTLILPN